MRSRGPYATLASTVVMVLCVASTAQAEPQRLVGRALATAVTGMDFGDGVHWSEHYGAGGVLDIVSMGRRIKGRWSLRDDRLCKETPLEGQCCYQVWRAREGIEQRPDCIAPVLEGQLSKP